MTTTCLVLSLGLGAGGGVLYGLFFLSLPSRLTAHPSKRSLLRFLLYSSSRSIFLILFWAYVLRTNSLDTILVTVSFLGAFWIATIAQRVQANGRR